MAQLSAIRRGLMETWSFVLLGFGMAVAAVVIYNAARAKRSSDQMLRQYESMLRDARQQSQSETPVPR